MKGNWYKSLFILLLLLVSSDLLFLQAQKNKSIFRDTADNGFDVSNYLLEVKGVLVVPSLITEPAVGYGGAVGLAYFHSSFIEKKGPPSISGLMVGFTQNETWAVGGFHTGYWKQDRIRYLGAMAKTNLNIDYYGSGRYLSEPVGLNMDAWFFLQQVKFRVASSPLFLGTGYMLYQTSNTFEWQIDIPEFEGITLNSLLSEISFLVNIDTWNNVLSPTKGLFSELGVTYSDNWLGGSDLYGRLSATVLEFIPLGQKFILGFRIDTKHVLGDVPFWSKPAVNMRGVPAIKYQDRNSTVLETEITYHLYRRWHMILFSGIANVYPQVSEFNHGQTVSTLGAGFRYELAKRLGLRSGMDFAWSGEDFAFYVVMGHAWRR